MAREATITQEQVNSAADSIRAAAGTPRPRAIREAMRSGSMATVLRMLQDWQAGQVQPAAQAITLPPALQRMLVDFMAHELAVARASLEAELVATQQAQADLIAESDRQVSTIEIQAAALESAQADKSELVGQRIRLETDLASLVADLQKERDAGERARIELGKAELRLESVPRLERDLERVRTDLDAAIAGRQAAEQAAAVATAKLEGVTEARSAAEAREKAAHVRAAELEKQNVACARELATANQSIQAVQARLDASGRELEDAKKAATEARATAKAAGEEAAELRGQIKAKGIAK